MNKPVGGVVLLLLSAVPCAGTSAAEKSDLRSVPRTSFQSFAPFDSRWAPPAELAMVYGVDPGVANRAESWRQAGYRIGIMTGVAWGGYQDYVDGRADGRKHRDSIQHDRAGKELSHGGGTVYYMSPSPSYVDYLCKRVRKTVSAVMPEYLIMEEPEYWVRAGYSGSFKEQWGKRYEEEWQPPHSSAANRWKASRLMYELYWHALDCTLRAAKETAEEKGGKVKCLVATHSLINYTCWGIVSPESSLMRLPCCDGIIAQAWTGTARSPIRYEGKVAERSFENGFLEYGIAANMDRIPGKEVWFLHDPVEDNPNHDWTDYRRNWEETVAASLLWPEVNRYEIMPWPDRIYAREYKSGPDTKSKTGIPKSYRNEIARVAAALQEMPDDSPGCFKWRSPNPGIGVVFSDTAMFMRAEPVGSSPHLDEFYGQALPLLKRGVAVRPVQAEYVHRPGFLEPYRLLMLSYDFQLPPSRQFNDALVRWVKGGGALLIVGRKEHPFFGVPGWWNDNGKNQLTPLEVLTDSLGLSRNDVGLVKAEKGWVHVIYKPAAEWAQSRDGSDECVRTVRGLFRKACPEAGWRETDYMLLERGPFLVGHVFSGSPGKPLHLSGRWVNLFSDSKDTVSDPVCQPGSSVFFRKAD